MGSDLPTTPICSQVGVPIPGYPLRPEIAEALAHHLERQIACIRIKAKLPNASLGDKAVFMSNRKHIVAANAAVCYRYLFPGDEAETPTLVTVSHLGHVNPGRSDIGVDEQFEHRHGRTRIGD